MPVQLPASLDDARVRGELPPAAYYIPDFISEDEEEAILRKIADAPKPRWKQLTHRRLQTWPSDLVQNKLIDAPLPPWLEEPVIPRLLSLHHIERHEREHGHDDGDEEENSDISRPSLFEDSPHHRPNHVLINEYPPGVGIMPHKASTMDGSAYHPVVCTVSLGASLCLNLYRSKDDGAMDPEPAWRILQEPRSLLVTTEDLYTEYLHGIADIEEDVDLTAATVANWELLRSPDSFASGQNRRGTRTSLTYRDVMKVSKLGSKFGGMLGKR